MTGGTTTVTTTEVMGSKPMDCCHGSAWSYFCGIEQILKNWIAASRDEPAMCECPWGFLVDPIGSLIRIMSLSIHSRNQPNQHGVVSPSWTSCPVIKNPTLPADASFLLASYNPSSVLFEGLIPGAFSWTSLSPWQNCGTSGEQGVACPRWSCEDWGGPMDPQISMKPWIFVEGELFLLSKKYSSIVLSHQCSGDHCVSKWFLNHGFHGVPNFEMYRPGAAPRVGDEGCPKMVARWSIPTNQVYDTGLIYYLRLRSLIVIVLTELLPFEDPKVPQSNPRPSRKMWRVVLKRRVEVGGGFGAWEGSNSLGLSCSICTARAWKRKRQRKRQGSGATDYTGGQELSHTKSMDQPPVGSFECAWGSLPPFPTRAVPFAHGSKPIMNSNHP